MQPEKQSRHALSVRKSPPAMQDLVHVLGKVPHQQLSAALERLKGLGLAPDWAWGGQKDGWNLAFRRGDGTVCSLLLAKIPVAGLVGVGKQIHEVMASRSLLPAAIQRKVDAAPLQGSLRVVELSLDTGTGLSQFQTLVSAKLAALEKLAL